MIKKAISLIITFCFLFSFVFSNTVIAIVETKKSDIKYNKLFDEFSIPTNIGSITKAKYLGSDEVVINIQDLHCHSEVQRNISQILSIIDSKYKLQKVFVEGAYGNVDTSWLAYIKDKEAKNTLVENLVDQGKLTGTEHYSIVSNRPDLLFGIEDLSLYNENILRLHKILRQKSKYDSYIALLREDLSVIQHKYFSRDNKNFERRIIKHKEGNIDSDKYYRLLKLYADKLNRKPFDQKRIANIDLSGYGNIVGYVDLLSINKKLKYKTIANQLQSFVGDLKKKLPYKAYNYLLKKTENFSKLDELYVYLIKIISLYELNVKSQYPQLNDFLEYVDKSQRVNPLDLIREEKKLVEEIRVGFAQDSSELDVAFVTEYFSYFEDFLNNRLSSNDYEYFIDRFIELKYVWSKYVEINRMQDLQNDFGILNKFNKVNLERNIAFINNILSKGTKQEAPDKIRDNILSYKSRTMTFDENKTKIFEALENYKKVIVVVTGGFHTKGLEALLAEKNISYIAITPNVTVDTKKSDVVYRFLAGEQARTLSKAAESLKQTQLKETQFKLSRALVNHNNSIISKSTKTSTLDFLLSKSKNDSGFSSGNIKKAIKYQLSQNHLATSKDALALALLSQSGSLIKLKTIIDSNLRIRKYLPEIYEKIDFVEFAEIKLNELKKNSRDFEDTLKNICNVWNSNTSLKDLLGKLEFKIVHKSKNDQSFTIVYTFSKEKSKNQDQDTGIVEKPLIFEYDGQTLRFAGAKDEDVVISSVNKKKSLFDTLAIWGGLGGAASLLSFSYLHSVIGGFAALVPAAYGVVVGTYILLAQNSSENQWLAKRPLIDELVDKPTHIDKYTAAYVDKNNEIHINLIIMTHLPAKIQGIIFNHENRHIKIKNKIKQINNKEEKNFKDKLILSVLYIPGVEEILASIGELKPLNEGKDRDIANNIYFVQEKSVIKSDITSSSSVGLKLNSKSLLKKLIIQITTNNSYLKVANIIEGFMMRYFTVIKAYIEVQQKMPEFNGKAIYNIFLDVTGDIVNEMAEIIYDKGINSIVITQFSERTDTMIELEGIIPEGIEKVYADVRKDQNNRAVVFLYIKFGEEANKDNIAAYAENIIETINGSAKTTRDLRNFYKEHNIFKNYDLLQIGFVPAVISLSGGLTFQKESVFNAVRVLKASKENIAEGSVFKRKSYVDIVVNEETDSAALLEKYYLKLAIKSSQSVIKARGVIIKVNLSQIDSDLYTCLVENLLNGKSILLDGMFDDNNKSIITNEKLKEIIAHANENGVDVLGSIFVNEGNLSDELSNEIAVKINEGIYDGLKIDFTKLKMNLNVSLRENKTISLLSNIRKKTHRQEVLIMVELNETDDTEEVRKACKELNIKVITKHKNGSTNESECVEFILDENISIEANLEKAKEISSSELLIIPIELFEIKILKNAMEILSMLSAKPPRTAKEWYEYEKLTGINLNSKHIAIKSEDKEAFDLLKDIYNHRSDEEYLSQLPGIIEKSGLKYKENFKVVFNYIEEIALDIGEALVNKEKESTAKEEQLARLMGFVEGVGSRMEIKENIKINKLTGFTNKAHEDMLGQLLFIGESEAEKYLITGSLEMTAEVLVGLIDLKLALGEYVQAEELLLQYSKRLETSMVAGSVKGTDEYNENVRKVRKFTKQVDNYSSKVEKKSQNNELLEIVNIYKTNPDVDNMPEELSGNINDVIRRFNNGEFFENDEFMVDFIELLYNDEYLKQKEFDAYLNIVVGKMELNNRKNKDNPLSFTDLITILDIYSDHEIKTLKKEIKPVFEIHEIKVMLGAA